MSETASATRVGVFVVGAAALALGAVVAFGSSRLFTKTERYVIHFEQSLMGLSLGAPVIFRGVDVGTVVDIHATLTRIDPPLIKTPVTIEIVADRVQRSADLPARREGDPDQNVQALIDTGLRAQLDIQSLVTGQLYVSLVIRPDTEPVYRAGGVDELPSIRSDLELIKETFVALAEELRSMPLKEVGANLVTIIDKLAELARAPETQEALEGLGHSVDQLNALLGSADSTVKGAYDEYLLVAGQARELMATAERTLQGIDRVVAPGSPIEQEVLLTLQEVRNTTGKLGEMVEQTLSDVGGLVDPDSPLQYEIRTTLQEVRRATQKLGAMADQLMTQPDSVLFGRGQRKDTP